MPFRSSELAEQLDTLHNLCFPPGRPQTKESLALWLQTAAAVASLETLEAIEDKVEEIGHRTWSIDDTRDALALDAVKTVLADIKQIKINTAPD